MIVHWLLGRTLVVGVLGAVMILSSLLMGAAALKLLETLLLSAGK